MPAPDLPTDEQPEAELPNTGAALPPEPQIEPGPEAASDLTAAPAEITPEPEAMIDPVDDALALPPADAVMEADSALPAETVAASEAAQPAQRPQLAVVVAGLLLIGLGIVLAWPSFSAGYILVPGVIMLIASVGVCLTLLAYWRQHTGQARGALFLSLLCLTWGLLTSILMLAPEIGGLAHLWPFYAILLGLAALLVALGERPIDSRVVSTGLVAVAAGGAALAVTWDLLQADLLATVREVGPWLLIILAIGLLPLVIRRVRPANSSDTSS